MLNADDDNDDNEGEDESIEPPAKTTPLDHSSLTPKVCYLNIFVMSYNISYLTKANFRPIH